jgi:hypothetical protein
LSTGGSGRGAAASTSIPLPPVCAPHCSSTQSVKTRAGRYYRSTTPGSHYASGQRRQQKHRRRCPQRRTARVHTQHCAGECSRPAPPAPALPLSHRMFLPPFAACTCSVETQCSAGAARGRSGRSGTTRWPHALMGGAGPCAFVPLRVCHCTLTALHPCTAALFNMRRAR